MQSHLFHHRRELQHAPFAVVHPVLRSDLSDEPVCDPDRCGVGGDDWHDRIEYEAAYRWLAEEQGFWPLFLGVGREIDAIHITGYDLQWKRRTPEDVAAGPADSFVLFSWNDPPDRCAFSDYMAWHSILRAVRWEDDHRARCEGIGPRVRSSVLKPSYRAADWLRYARRFPGYVQATAPSLDLRTADVVWCRNRAAREELMRRGFAAERVAVRRVPVLR